MGAGHHLAAGHPRRTARTGVLGTAGRAIGGHLAVAPAPVRGTAEARRRLNAACQWLWVLGWAVQAAHERDPVTAADLRLLHAIPLHALARRHLPDGTEPVTRLCQGTIDTAERVRRHARAAISRASWSPDLTMESLRETAACATIISHNCQVLLDTLTRPAGQHPEPGLTASLAAAADAAGNARRAWLHAARGWDLITTDTRGTLSPAAAETADLALWTGRLAYADPAWTPDLGPSRTVRPAAQLTELPAVIAAVHHACETLTQVAAADHAQLTAAARTGRLLVPTRSLPEEFDIPHRFAPAPAARTQPLLTAYHDARTASAQATASTAVVAETVRSPSRILTTARTAVASNTSTTSLRPDAPLAPAASRPGPALPGPVERILRDLGETSIAMLQQATAIDQAAEQLILHTAHQPDHPARPATRDPSRSAATAEVINHILTSAHPATAAILCAPEPAHPRNLKK